MSNALRRRTLILGLTLIGVPGSAVARQTRQITVYKTPWCGCCDGWVEHLRANGWTPRVVVHQDLAPVRARHGIPDRMASCHTGVVGQYAIEGHVPASDIARLLVEAPEAVALAAPGMPAGSPGMEAAGREPYVTRLVMGDGSTRIFERHNGA
jgi:Predicted metal-binding protein